MSSPQDRGSDTRRQADLKSWAQAKYQRSLDYKSAQDAGAMVDPKYTPMYDEAIEKDRSR